MTLYWRKLYSVYVLAFRLCCWVVRLMVICCVCVCARTRVCVTVASEFYSDYLVLFLEIVFQHF